MCVHIEPPPFLKKEKKIKTRSQTKKKLGRKKKPLEYDLLPHDIDDNKSNKKKKKNETSNKTQNSLLTKKKKKKNQKKGEKKLLCLK